MRRKEAIIIFYLIQNNVSLESKSKPLPYFRRQVEGVQEDSTLDSLSDDISSNLVSILVKNAKEIFDDINEGNKNELTTPSLIPDALKVSTEPTPEVLISVHPTLTTNVLLYENASQPTLINPNFNEPLIAKDDIEKSLKSELMQLTKEMKSYEKSDIKIEDATVLDSINSLVLETTEQSDQNFQSELKRSCIFCNNILSENCDDPQNKIIPTITCERDGDLCYSQHTPFGVIDRGCYNVNHNLTTYVCSCNLCNYISISEMPYIFSNKQAWLDNVVELTRTKKFRKSVFKDMSCLRCEVNTTTSPSDLFDSANCLEGNIGNLPVEDCGENEICAVRAVRSDGYIWRGCVRLPLYNYWWTLCDTDLCNHDTLVSLYDFVAVSKISVLGSTK